MHIVLFALAILVVALMPLVPKAVRLRIRVLRWIGWNWAANLLADPDFTYHLKQSVKAAIKAKATRHRIITGLTPWMTANYAFNC